MRTSFETLTYRAPPAPREAGLLRAEAPDRAGLFEPQCPHLSTGLSCIFFMVVGGGAAKRKKIPGLRRGPERQDHQAARAPSPVGGLGQQRWGGAWVAGSGGGGRGLSGAGPGGVGAGLIRRRDPPKAGACAGAGRCGDGAYQEAKPGGWGRGRSGVGDCLEREPVSGPEGVGTGPIRRQDPAAGDGACREAGPGGWGRGLLGGGACLGGSQCRGREV